MLKQAHLELCQRDPETLERARYIAKTGCVVQLNYREVSTRNNDVLLKVPRVKLEMAKASFFFYGSEIL